jgi:hypothetical protein
MYFTVRIKIKLKICLFLFTTAHVTAEEEITITPVGRFACSK